MVIFTDLGNILTFTGIISGRQVQYLCIYMYVLIHVLLPYQSLRLLSLVQPAWLSVYPCGHESQWRLWDANSPRRIRQVSISLGEPRLTLQCGSLSSQIYDLVLIKSTCSTLRQLAQLRSYKILVVSYIPKREHETRVLGVHYIFGKLDYT